MAVASPVEAGRARRDEGRVDGGWDGDALVGWLVTQALPRWTATGVDRSRGGFFEKLTMTGQPVDEPRRTRVVARQIYVFATAARHGWSSEGDALVDHGLDFLLNRMRLPDGTFASAVHADGAIVDSTFDLYEQAFALFALAAAARGRPARAPALRREAESLLDRLQARWGHPLAGFDEAVPRSLPLKSNPHMHLLEAAIAWADISEGAERTVWAALADELCGLCLDRFVDPASGALREYFDGDWRPMADARGRIVEPGHQFEWAWLLMRWNRDWRPDRAAVAARLLAIGETHGVDAARGIAVDVLDDAFHIQDAAAKLWPQTERIKAWHAVAVSAGHGGAAAHAVDRCAAAIGGLARYLTAAPSGLWQEQMRPDGGFVAQDCRASSLYHIVCAIDTLVGEPTGDGR